MKSTWCHEAARWIDSQSVRLPPLAEPVALTDVDEPATVGTCISGDSGRAGGRCWLTYLRAKRARAQLGEALTTFTDLQDGGGKVNALWNWGRLLTSEGDYLQAARLLGAIYGYERTLGKKIWCCAALGQHHLEFLRSNADPDLVAKAFADGQRMTLDAAVQHAHEQLAGS